jgi:spore photoproduct lyase
MPVTHDHKMPAAVPRPGRIIVEADVADSPLLATLRSRLPEAAVEVVDRISDRDSFDSEVLEVVRFRGRFLKACPGTRHYFCCDYRILHFGLQCTLDCTYCILQAYLNQGNLRLFGNTGEMFDELSAELQAHPDTLYRIGTGEFTDSLLLDPWTGLSRTLVPFFARQTNAVLELKTKTTSIENLIDLEHEGHTIVAWSLNSPAVRKREESKAAPLKDRIDAARRCSDLGYWLAFHFDPLIEHDNWREGYGEIIERLFEKVDSDRVVWISLGAFRFMPDLKSIVQRRHPKSRIPYGEFIRGLDDKMRYFRDIRVDLYSFVLDRIKKAAPNVCVYLCMEGRDIWREVFGFSPEEIGGLPAILDRAVKEKMKVGLHCLESEGSKVREN